MQVTETLTEGLKRQFRVVVPAADIEGKVKTRLSELAKSVKLPGFRPGKVPESLMRQRYGQSVTGEVLQATVNEATTKAVTDRGLKAALQPKVEIVSFEEGKDLEYKVDVEVLPEFEPSDLGAIALEKVVIEVTDGQINEAIERLAKSQKSSKPLEAPRAAKEGDLLILDFNGTVDGEEQPGMKASDQRLELGSKQFIPGFEEQLVGAKAGEDREVKVTFPADYPAEKLQGKEAIFKVQVKDIQEVVHKAIDDELAKAVGMDDLAQLKSRVQEQLTREHAQLARSLVKRKLLDALAAAHTFDVPAGMVDLEFDSIWKQIEADKEAGRLDPEDQGKSDETLKSEYRAIAERRVRLGLLLSEVGRRNGVEVAQDELNAAIVREVQRFPGQEDKVLDYLRKTPQAVASIRAPIYEDKVIDYIIGIAKTTEKTVSLEDFNKLSEEAAASI